MHPKYYFYMLSVCLSIYLSLGILDVNSAKNLKGKQNIVGQCLVSDTLAMPT